MIGMSFKVERPLLGGDLGVGKSVFLKYSLKFYAQEPTPNPSQEGNNLCHDKICGFKLYTDSRSLSVSPQNPHKENENSYTLELGRLLRLVQF